MSSSVSPIGTAGGGADAAAKGGAESALEAPPFRRLRVYAFDPSLDTQMENAVVNRVTAKVQWEPLGLGPVGEYIEVVDYDPASRCFYTPVNLEHPYLLAEDGLEPSESSPQFHQQMVYAVTMLTVRNFEKALGRTLLWSPRIVVGEDGAEQEVFVRRLRIYPHAMRTANAYYTPSKKALLFGYFPAASTDPGRHMPRGIVFTCLSHDVVAHESTHAILDGMNRRYLEATNPDVLAFHEAFADIVALFQHFSMPEVLRHQIARTRGDLASQNMLGQLAQQFGETTGRYGALRDALGKVNPETGKWEAARPDPGELERVTEPHERGSILVGAVFDAFLSIYKSRVADLLRIATGGSGVLAAGELHPDLVNRLAFDAAKSASHVLTMCIRALDYCPPVDITFGEYLRALITADYDLVRDDDRHYRVAFIEAFRRRGIYPSDIRTLSTESLRWQTADLHLSKSVVSPPFAEGIKGLREGWNLTSDRGAIFELLKTQRKQLCDWLSKELTPEQWRALGLDYDTKDTANPNNPADDVNKRPAYEVTSLRPVQRIGPDGQHLVDLIIEIVQSRWELNETDEEEEEEEETEGGGEEKPAPPPPLANADGGFWFRGGCTVVFDVQRRVVRYCIRKDIGSDGRLQRQREFQTQGAMPSLQATYFGRLEESQQGGAFAMLHAADEGEEVLA